MTTPQICVTLMLTAAHYLFLLLPITGWINGDSDASALWLLLYTVLAGSLAIDVTELSLSIFLGRKRPLLNAGSPQRKDTAILMTICDDNDLDALLCLGELAQAGYPVFVLDDSASPTQLPPEIAGIVSYRWRSSRTSAKAGNLNEWLATSGEVFASILLLDSDSVVPVDSADLLLRAATQPANADIAIFQAKIAVRSNQTVTLLSGILSIGVLPRARVLERVHARFGLLLSFGHNQLIRLSALQKVGGFPDDFSSEDTALSLRLSEIGYRTDLVDCWSYDTEPRSVTAYTRRTVRWARQTVELFGGNWHKCSLRLKLVLCRQLFSYLNPTIGFVLLMVSFSQVQASTSETIQFMDDALSFADGYELYGLAIWTSMTSLGLRFVLHILLAHLEGVKPIAFAIATLFAPSVQVMLLVPVTLGMMLSMLGRRVPFIPTNTRRSNTTFPLLSPRFLAYIILACISYFSLITKLQEYPSIALIGFNAVWIFGFVTAPIFFVVMQMRCPKAFRLKNGLTVSEQPIP